MIIKHFGLVLLLQNESSNLNLDLRAVRPWLTGSNISVLYVGAVHLKNFIMLTQTQTYGSILFFVGSQFLALSSVDVYILLLNTTT